MTKTRRRDFIRGMAASVALGTSPAVFAGGNEDFIDGWIRETDLVRRADYLAYLQTGANPKGLVSLDRLDRAFDTVAREIDGVRVGDVPAVWLVYNMGVVVKTRETLFSIDLCHRRAPELAPRLDFALITHNHEDHYTPAFYQAMDGQQRKLVISNFADNYGGARWKKELRGFEPGGYTRAEKTFRIKDVEIRTSLADHNSYLVDYTTVFEIRVGDWKLLHTGDCSNFDKVRPVWGRPDLWIEGLGFGEDSVEGEKRLRPKLTAMGHMTELGHDNGRLRDPRGAAARVRRAGGTVMVPRWGERIRSDSGGGIGRVML